MTVRKVLILKQGFDPEPTMKGLLFAQKIAARNLDVQVVTGFPNYPGGKVYNGYHIRPIKRELMDGMSVTRLALFPSHNQSKIGRVLNYLSFFISSFIHLSFSASKSDVIYVYHPPLTVGLAALASKLLHRTPIVIDVQDLWPDTLRATGMINNSSILWIVNILCNWVYKKAFHIIVLSPGFRKTIVGRGVPEHKITVIPNWADEKAVETNSAGAAEHFNDTDEFRVLFAGNMGRAQSLVTVLEAAKSVALTNDRISFYFLGSGLELDELKTWAKDNAISNAFFIPRVPMADVGAYLSSADCLLVHLKDDPLFRITIPSKTQAYMAAGKPIIMGVSGDAADMVREAKAGIVVPPDNPSALAEAVINLSRLPKKDIDNMGANGRRYYREHLSMEKGIDELVRIFRSVET